MGVWIETEEDNQHYKQVRVTPCMGVWIETSMVSLCSGRNIVTPCMGVWIETAGSSAAQMIAQRHTLYGCVD